MNILQKMHLWRFKIDEIPTGQQKCMPNNQVNFLFTIWLSKYLMYDSCLVKVTNVTQCDGYDVTQPKFPFDTGLSFKCGFQWGFRSLLLSKSSSQIIKTNYVFSNL